MAGIGGCVSRDRQSDPEQICRALLERLRNWGGDSPCTAVLDRTGFCRLLTRRVPEDRFDQQPLTSASGRYLLVADIRIDNRDEIATALGLGPGLLGGLSDSAVLLRAIEAWGPASFEKVLGDGSLGLWDVERQRLILARTALSTRPLFYTLGRRITAFASAPQALTALPQVPLELNIDEAAANIASVGFRDGATLFRNVQRVGQGQAVIIAGPDVRTVQLWDPAAARPRVPAAEAGDAMRHELERAVKAQMRRGGGTVASQLSGGRDSGAVTATAARILAAKDERLLALTGAPIAEFDEGEGGEWIADESALAAATALLSPNIDHVVCRSRADDLMRVLQRVHRIHSGPALNLANAPWWEEVNAAAAQRGTSVLLTGITGNFSISSGGIAALSDLRREAGWDAWLRAARAIRTGSRSSWRVVGNASFGGMLPRQIHAALVGLSGRAWDEPFSVPMLRAPYRARVEALAEAAFRDRRPARSYRAFRREWLLAQDGADQTALVAHGLDVRDPTADRRLVELCLSLPADQLVGPDGNRPAFARAFADRLPEDLVAGRRRAGYQGADWFEVFQPEDIRACFAVFGKHRTVSELIDLAAVDQLLENWPTANGRALKATDLYRNKLLATLATASFIVENFPD